MDLDGDHLIPGMVDVHTDNLERQVQPRAKVRWPVRAAMLAHDAEIAAAGVTTVLDALCLGDLGVAPRARPERAARRARRAARPPALLRPSTASTCAASCRRPMRSSCRARRRPSAGAADQADGPHAGPAPVRDIEHARVYYTGKKGWSQATVDRRGAHRAGARRPQLCRAAPRLVADCARERDMPLATHDDTTRGACRRGAARRASSISEFPTTLEAAREARARRPRDDRRRAQHRARRLAFGQRRGRRPGARRRARRPVVATTCRRSLLQAAWALHRDAGFSLAGGDGMVTAGRPKRRACTTAAASSRAARRPGACARTGRAPGGALRVRGWRARRLIQRGIEDQARLVAPIPVSESTKGRSRTSSSSAR